MSFIWKGDPSNILENASVTQFTLNIKQALLYLHIPNSAVISRKYNPGLDMKF